MRNSAAHRDLNIQFEHPQVIKRTTPYLLEYQPGYRNVPFNLSNQIPVIHIVLWWTGKMANKHPFIIWFSNLLRTIYSPKPLQKPDGSIRSVHMLPPWVTQSWLTACMVPHQQTLSPVQLSIPTPCSPPVRQISKPWDFPHPIPLIFRKQLMIYDSEIS